jgi:hypothetical protein
MAGQLFATKATLALDTGQGQEIVFDELGDGLCIAAFTGLVIPRRFRKGLRGLRFELGSVFAFGAPGLGLECLFLRGRLIAGQFFLTLRLQQALSFSASYCRNAGTCRH